MSSMSIRIVIKQGCHWTVSLLKRCRDRIRKPRAAPIWISSDSDHVRHLRALPQNAADLMNDRVVPFFDERVISRSIMGELGRSQPFLFRCPQPCNKQVEIFLVVFLRVVGEALFDFTVAEKRSDVVGDGLLRGRHKFRWHSNGSI